MEQIEGGKQRPIKGEQRSEVKEDDEEEEQDEEERRAKKAQSSLGRGEKESDGDDGEEKDSDHADYG